MTPPTEVARLPLPTVMGTFDLRAFRCASGDPYLLLARGDLGDGRSVLTRLHSGCLTGDAFGSLRCECGPQLALAMRRIAAEGRGIVLYAPTHEGRGIGLLAKLQAYVLQDQGADTVDANRQLGLPADGRDFGDAVRVLAAAGIRSVRLLSNNPRKAAALDDGGIAVEAMLPLQVAPHVRNRAYLETKQRRLGHRAPGGAPVAGVELGADPAADQAALDVTGLLGAVRPPPGRPYVVLKYAQSLDGRIATADGDAKWISGPAERRVSHALRAACDAVLVGSGTVRADDPLLTVRLVPGASPTRVVLDSALRTPAGAKVLDASAATLVLTTARSSPARRAALRERGVIVEVVGAAPAGIDLGDALARLAALGIRVVLVEGGARVITSLLRDRLADRLVVGVAPLLLGRGTDAVGDLGAARVADGLRLRRPAVHQAGPDLLLAGDLDGTAAAPGRVAGLGRGAVRP
jgi:3,4-dihydroxy 2-butanone 4-phosphate synthase/GTP cyclohydrolase II